MESIVNSQKACQGVAADQLPTRWSLKYTKKCLKMWGLWDGMVVVEDECQLVLWSVS
ncbi:MAG: hypothetical protein WC272_11085 [Sulfurimonas sp.]